ncbi:MAG: hypothetical protein ACSLFI_12160 [Solirubrobacterales bacterium]
MTPRTYLHSAITLTVVMFGLLLLMIPIGANLGPVELSIWLAILVVGLSILTVGGVRTWLRTRPAEPTAT